MSDITVLHLLLLSQGAQWVLLINHLLRCRDMRVDVYRIKVHTGMIRP
jgi:hypothetical protein